MDGTGHRDTHADPGAALGDVAPLSALDDPVRRRLYDYVCEQDQPVSRDQASGAAGIGRTLAAYHLDRLEAAGLLSVEYQRPEGRGGPGAGRPAKLYRRAEREFSVTLPPRDYELLTQVLLESVERDTTGTVRDATGAVAERMGRAAGEASVSGAAGTVDGAEVLTSALRLCGYQPSLQDAGDITLRNCPFDRAAKTHRDIVCLLNLRLVQGLVDGVGGDPTRAALEPTPGHCCVVIHPEG